jgi:hypothetical protein
MVEIADRLDSLLGNVPDIFLRPAGARGGHMPSKIALRTVGSVLLVAASLAAEPIRAAEPGTATTEAAAPTTAVDSARGRVLNGHVFMPAVAVQGALVTTSFQSALLVGYGSTTATFNVSDQVLSGTFEYAGIGAVLGYEYAFTDNLSVRLAMTELIFSGTTGRSAIVVGTQLQGGIGAGLTFSLPVGNTLRVGALFDASAAPNFGLTIGNGLSAVIDTCGTPAGCDLGAGGFFQKKNVVQLQPALAANWAPFPALGVTGNVSYINATQHLNGTDFTGDALAVAVALDFDFRAISSVPIGLQAQFSWTAPNGGSALQHVSDFGGGIFYTGRKNLALGLQVIDRRFGVTPDVDVSWKTFLANVGLRYYW